MGKMDMTVLVVEDDEITRVQIREILKRYVSNIIEARNGSDGLVQFQKNHPDLVLTDIRMPEMDGLEMIEILKESYTTFHCIVMSSYDDAEYLFKAINLDVNGYMVKPLSKEKLLKRITEVYERKKIKDEENANKASINLLSNISHELKTPLIGIIGFSEMMMEAEEDQEKKELLQIIYHSGNKLAGIIDNLIDYTKISDGILTMNKKKFTVDEIMENLEKKYKKYAEEKGIELRISIDNSGTEITGDFEKIEHIIGHIVSNGIKFTESGYVEIKSSNMSENIENILEIEVRDTGIGMSKETVKKIFKPFTQGEKYMTKKYGGTGLGMTIVKNLIEFFNGYIDIESISGQGTVVTLGIPIIMSEIKNNLNK